MENEKVIDVEAIRNERAEQRAKDERFERRMQTTVWAVRKTVKWAVIGSAAAFVYHKLTDGTDEVPEGEQDV